MRVVLAFEVLALACLSVACGPASRRDADVPPNVVTFDDTCKLQSYFDERRASNLEPVKPTEETVTTGKGPPRGQGVYPVRDAHARKRFARLLKQEYEGVEPAVLRAVAKGGGTIVVRVRWWDRGGVRRLRPDEPIIVQTSAGTAALPFNTCVGDFLFGDALYEARARSSAM